MMGGKATFIAEPLTTTRKALSITVAVTHHLYDVLSGVITRLRRGVGTEVDAGAAAVWFAVRDNAIWGLYIKGRIRAKEFCQTIGKIINTVKEKISATTCSNPGAWGLACSRWRVFILHDFRSNGFLDISLVQTKKAHATNRIRMCPGLKEATHLVHTQWIVEELHALRRVDIHRLVLACGQFTAVVANG